VVLGGTVALGCVVAVDGMGLALGAVVAVGGSELVLGGTVVLVSVSVDDGTTATARFV